jgi:hypothetical protein
LQLTRECGQFFLLCFSGRRLAKADYRPFVIAPDAGKVELCLLGEAIIFADLAVS